MCAEAHPTVEACLLLRHHARVGHHHRLAVRTNHVAARPWMHHLLLLTIVGRHRDQRARTCHVVDPWVTQLAGHAMGRRQHRRACWGLDHLLRHMRHHLLRHRVGRIEALLDEEFRALVDEDWLQLRCGERVDLAALGRDEEEDLRAGQPAELIRFLRDAGLALREGDVPSDLVFDVLDLDLATAVPTATLSRGCGRQRPDASDCPPKSVPTTTLPVLLVEKKTYWRLK